MIQRRNVIIGTLSATAAAASLGGSATSSASVTGLAEETVVPAAPVAPVRVSVTPKRGATAVSPTSPIAVSVADGRLESVVVTTGTTIVSGAVRADGTWHPTGKLAYGKKYKVVVTATDSAGAPTATTSTFTTVKPQHLVETTFRANAMSALQKGHSYGAGQPVIIAFSRAVNKAAAEKAIRITTSPAVEGRFYWPDGKTVHWRPEKYWAGGTAVTVQVNAFGVRLGNGVYGEKNTSTHFTVGRQLITIVDSKTHRAKVYIDGKLVRTMKCSLGRGGSTTGANGQHISFWTAGGPHVVLSKERVHSMSSASYGVTDPSNPNYYAPEDIEYCTRITYSGEFLHAAPWNHSLGRANLSHGCVNLSVSDAKWVYENFRIGDVVDVRHSPRTLQVWNGVGDWTIPFHKYGR